MIIGILTLNIQFPGCKSLKEKRGFLKPLLTRLHRQFNLSVAEIGKQDVWDEAVIGCAMISNDHAFSQNALQSVIHWIEHNQPEAVLVDDHIEIIT